MEQNHRLILNKKKEARRKPSQPILFPLKKPPQLMRIPFDSPASTAWILLPLDSSHHSKPPPLPLLLHCTRRYRSFYGNSEPPSIIQSRTITLKLSYDCNFSPILLQGDVGHQDVVECVDSFRVLGSRKCGVRLCFGGAVREDACVVERAWEVFPVGWGGQDEFSWWIVASIHACLNFYPYDDYRRLVASVPGYHSGSNLKKIRTILEEYESQPH
ncbi:hypothetical protein KSP39_PZI002258 [Platanthera zijinensis]|uniref:Uncharacterized protein n=1 Tax=Platanthera zijinensis TaxID=2320716 RepID=A0AAP0C164_9ASPA